MEVADLKNPKAIEGLGQPLKKPFLGDQPHIKEALAHSSGEATDAEGYGYQRIERKQTLKAEYSLTLVDELCEFVALPLQAFCVESLPESFSQAQRFFF